ncbi:MAG: AraC family transcriptional regulator [Bacteroidales bacterium]|nr:AraC family transcriptional regulator [Bacteroidales bacterium]
MISQTESEYISRINKAFDYIEANIQNQFSLQELASVANFSKFHFHRIFYSIVGETPFQFITRVRIEKAATLLKSAKKDSISDIAFKCGFTDISIFSRNFKATFGISASEYRKHKIKDSNLSQTDSNLKQSKDALSMYFCSRSKTIKWRTNMELNKSVGIQEFPKMTVAYIRHIGAYKGNSGLFESIWNRLFAWAGPRGLIGGENFKSLVVYHDDPDVTEDDKLRISICITVPPDTKVDGEVGKMEVDGGSYAVGRFELDDTQFTEAWSWFYGQWLPASGYQCDDKPCLEMYPEEPKNGKFIVDICVPVKPL